MSINKKNKTGKAKGFKSRPESGGSKSRPENTGFQSRSGEGIFKKNPGKRGFEKLTEKDGSKSRSVKGGFKPRSEEGGFASRFRKSGFKKLTEKFDSSSQSGKADFQRRAEEDDVASQPGRGSQKRRRDSGSSKTRPDKGALKSRSDKRERKERTGKLQKNRSEHSPSKPGLVAQKDYLRDEIRLNKYISHSGFCSRREADEYIAAGEVRVNGKIIAELGKKVKATDRVQVGKQRISLEPFVYILLNKARDTISTTSDEKDRNTVLDVVEDATGHRVYPVGRLDRNTLGLILLTKDGDLAHRLKHPSYKVKKMYVVTTNPPLSDTELEQYRKGIVLEDGPVKAVQVKRVTGDANSVTISVYEGRNHLIRRMASHFGADVIKLKRVSYAGLTDKDLRVGRWRYLKQKEINDLRKLVKLDKLDFNKEET